MNEHLPSAPLFHELTRDDVRVASADALLLLPVAAGEQHGPHLPASTDRIIVEYVAHAAAAAAAQHAPIVVAPTLPLGQHDYALQDSAAQ